MNKFQSMAKIMAILCEESHLKPGTPVYKIVRERVSERIDILGPDATLLNVIDRKPQILDQIKTLINWRRKGRPMPIIRF
jgi:hypothetical protein